jgi:hypothetical protein
MSATTRTQHAGTLLGISLFFYYFYLHFLFICKYSMSLGGGAATALDSAVEQSIAGGVTYSIAAGNDNANACKYDLSIPS